MAKDNFIFNAKWKDALQDFPADVRLEVYEAIIDYASTGSVGDLTQMAKMAFSFVRLEVDKNAVRYEETCEKRREAGRKGGLMGGAPKGNQNASKTKQNKAKQSKISKTEQNKDDNDNDNDYDNELQLPNGNMSNNNLSIEQVNASSNCEQSDESMATHKKQNLEKLKQVDEVIEYYNSKITEKGARLRVCEKKTERRVSAILLRIKENGIEDVLRMIDKAVVSNGLNYELSIAPVGIDWIMRPNNFPKVLEGNYDNRDRAPRNGNNRSMSEDRYIGMIHTEGENDPSVWEREKEKAKQYKR